MKPHNKPRKASKELLTRVARNLKTLRIKRGMSQRDLERVSDVDRCHISGIENKKYNVSLAILELLAEGLECELSDLVDK